MNIMVVMGLFFGIISIFIGIPGLLTDVSGYLDPQTFILVLGCTIGATMIGTSWADFVSILKIISGYMYFLRKSISNIHTVHKIVEIAEDANRNGNETVLDMGKDYGDGFLDRALTLMGTGLDASFIRATLETDIFEEKKRHIQIISMIRAMGSFATMFGMMGTVMGIMKVLENVTDIDSVIAGMGLALLTTLYGLLLSSLFFIPISNQLKYLNEEDALTKEIILEGVMAIMAKEIPLKVEKKLMAYLKTAEKSKKKLQ